MQDKILILKLILHLNEDEERQKEDNFQDFLSKKKKLSPFIPFPADSSITKSPTSSSDSSDLTSVVTAGVELRDFLPGLAAGVFGVPGREAEDTSGGIGCEDRAVILLLIQIYIIIKFTSLMDFARKQLKFLKIRK